LSETVDRLLELALERGAIKYGDFTLTSGKKSSYYFDGRRLHSYIGQEKQLLLRRTAT